MCGDWIFSIHALLSMLFKMGSVLFALTSLGSAAAAVSSSGGGGGGGGSNLKNVLFFMVDDLRPNLGAYGAHFMSTPEMDRLASDGVLFNKAYVQYSFCAPSRNSFMTGRRPDATRAFSFMRHFRQQGVGDKWQSMPQHFRETGLYSVAGFGKTFHPGLPPSFDAAKSWDSYVYPGSCQGNTNGFPVLESNLTNKVTCPKVFQGCTAASNKTGALVAADSSGGARWCAVDTTKISQPLGDTAIVNAAEQYLEQVAANKDAATGKPKQPFFMGVGFHKPHLPFQFPAEYLDKYPSRVDPPLHPNSPEGMPLCAWHEGNFLNTFDSPCKDPSEYRRAYYAAVSYTDANIGQVLAKLDELGMTNDTVVGLIGDHGWQLGEMNLWRKMTNFELGVRVPLILKAPWKIKSVGVKSEVLAEAVDLFPTFVSLAGLPAVPASEGLQGTDLSPVFDARDPGKKYAFSQFAKRYSHAKELDNKKVLWDECTRCENTDIVVMGFSVRDERWRYTEWVDWNGTRPIWSSVVGRELYDHGDDDGTSFDKSSATINVWNASSANKNVVSQLSAVVHAHFNGDHQAPDVLQE